MGILVDGPTKVITVNQIDCTLVSGSLYSLDTEAVFRTQVNAWSASEEGLPYQRPIDHNSEYTVFGATYARKVEVINSFSVQFLPDTDWSVLLQGSNNNIADIENGILIKNSVLPIPNNAAGLIVRESGVSGLTAQESAMLTHMRDMFEADFVYNYSAGTLHYRRRGTTDELIPAKNIAGTSAPGPVTAME